MATPHPEVPPGDDPEQSRGARGTEPPSAPAAPSVDGAGAARAYARRVATTGVQPKRKGHDAPIVLGKECEVDEPAADEDDAGEPRPATGSRKASSRTSTSETVTKVSTRAERPLWQRAAPPELDYDEVQIWHTACRHVDPECDDEGEYETDPRERRAWLGHLERLAAVAARRRQRRAGGAAS
jgi:hypothetical protein